MIEQVAAAAGRDVPRETVETLSSYVDMLGSEALRQNLISKSTLATIWERHILDSAQLVRFEPDPGARWLDIGSGAGLPGIVIALLTAGKMTLTEPRRLRAEFLQNCVRSLGIESRVEVVPQRVERIGGKFDVITARAVAPLSNLLEISSHLSTGKTQWVLPKGRSAESELAEARRAWQGVFHVEQSVTDAEAKILVATGIGARKR